MHIGLYTECLVEAHTGIEQMTRSLVEELSMSHAVTCFHSKDSRHPPLEKIRHHLFNRPIPVHFYHTIASLFRWSCFNGVDVLHLPYPRFPYVRQPKVPVVVTIHDIIPVLYPQMHTWKRNIYFKYFIMPYLKKSNAIIAVSHTTKSDLIRYFGIPKKKITVVHNGLPEREYKHSKKKEPYILYLGTLEPRKNVEGILKAYALIKSRGFSHKLVIAGKKGWDYQNIFTLIKQLGLSNEIIYKGYVSEKQKKELYQKAALFVWPSFYEGFGLPVLEAMAYGTPVVTSNTSALLEVVGDAAIVVNPRDPKDIARGMQEVLASSTQYNKMIKKGLKRAKIFSRKAMVKKTIAVYEKIL